MCQKLSPMKCLKWPIRPRVYPSHTPNFILIEHKRAEIQSREVKNYEEKNVLHHCDLDLWPKVTNLNRVRASAVSNLWAKTAFKSVYPFGLNFVHKQSRTHSQTHRHTDKLKWKYNPSTISWRSKKKNKKTKTTRSIQRTQTPPRLWPLTLSCTLDLMLEIQSREVNRELWKNQYFVIVTLTFDPRSPT